MFLDRLIRHIPDKPKVHCKIDPAVLVAQSALFDEVFYMQEMEGISGPKSMSPSMHYVRFGASQQLSPHPWFDPGYYQSQVGDVENPLLHYLEFGKTSGVSPHPNFHPDQVPSLSHLAKRKTPLEDYLRYVVRYGRKKLLPNEFKNDIPTGKPIFLDFNNRKLNFEHGRYTFLIVAMCCELGHPVFVLESDDIVQFANKFRFFKTMLDDDYVKVLKHENEIPTDALRFTDKKTTKQQKSILVWKRGTSQNRDLDMVWPVPMHPAQYLRRTHRNLSWLRQRQRNTRVLFSGEVNWKYRFPIIKLKHGKTSRHALIKILHDQFQSKIDSRHYYPTFPICNRKEDDPVMLVFDQRKDRIPSYVWLDRMSYASFFISAPGAYFPMAHNSTEAMAVGTIPILEFSEYFSPQLEDGVNCLTYKGKDGFAKTIERALNMPEAEITKIREGVICYYDAHLKLEAFTEKLINTTEEGADFYFHFEHRL